MIRLGCDSEVETLRHKKTTIFSPEDGEDASVARLAEHLNWYNATPYAHLTVVVVHKGKVVKSFAYESVNDKDVDAAEAELKKSVEKK